MGTNSVTVVFWDAETGKNNSVTAQDVALVAQQGVTIATTVQYPGFTNSDIATKVASRDLKALSTPLAHCVVYANRRAANLNIGDVFRLRWSEYGIRDVAMRVSNIELGELTSNLVRISCVQDVFGFSDAVYAPPPPSEWVNPVRAPAPCPYRAVIEAPYYELAQILGDTAAQSLDQAAGYVAVAGTRPSGDAVNASILSTFGGNHYSDGGTMDFSPTATLREPVDKITKTFTIATEQDLDLVNVGTYALIDEEFVVVTSVADTEIQVGRGVLDSIPATHATGARLLFIDEFVTTDRQEYLSGERLSIKLLPITGQGQLTEASAPIDSVVFDSRAFRPYPPGNVRVNGEYFPERVTEPLTISWAHRDRTQQTAGLVAFDDGDIGPEPGTEYRLEIYDSSETKIVDATLSENQWTDIDGDVPAGEIRIKLWTLRDSTDSRYNHDFTVELEAT